MMVATCVGLPKPCRSDMDPTWKVQKFGRTEQSLKFAYMCALQERDGTWGTEQIEEHGKWAKEVLAKSLLTI